MTKDAQQELPGMPEDTPLGAAAKRFVAVKERIAQAKLDSAEIEKDILAEMRNESCPLFKISVGGENYEFELLVGTDSLRCAKITKTVKKAEKATAAPEPEPAAA